MTLGRLPPTTHDFIFRDLSVRDLRNLSKVNKTANDAVKKFYQRALRVENVLSPFFTHEEIRRFRILQFTIGFLIAGSTALSFFERAVYPESDLDLYVDSRYTVFLTDFLISAGFTFHPIRTEHKRQPADITDALEEMEQKLQRLIEEDGLDDDHEYRWTAIAEVFQFSRNGKSIQVIASGKESLGSPLHIVFDYHSTVVMNVIGYTHAVSFYPKTTFIDRVTVVNSIATARRDQGPPRAKYEARGWQIRKTLDAADTFDRNSELGKLDRAIGDEHCWTVPLQPVAEFVPSDMRLGEAYMLFANSWSNEHKDRKSVAVKARPFFLPSLTQSYCLSKRVFSYASSNFRARVSTDPATKYIDALFANFVNTAVQQPVKQSKKDAFVVELLGAAFRASRKQFPALETTHQVSSLQGQCLQEFLQDLISEELGLPKFIFRFAQNCNGALWTNVDVYLPLSYVPNGGGLVVDEDRRSLLRGHKINLEIKIANAVHDSLSIEFPSVVQDD
ncbi:hypothetical protein VNI00_014039 [Paramarasmius palmivorus]|uniref:F-box domain-containing protein n=1 Tax=Paramarasmius palmivorus TaxID=297713 RepID=A0AAW0BV92_9AGAR